MASTRGTQTILQHSRGWVVLLIILLLRQDNISCTMLKTATGKHVNTAGNRLARRYGKND
jgi:hypothetical protein